MYPLEVAIAKNKGKVIVMSMGVERFARVWNREKKTTKDVRKPLRLTYIPHGMVVETKCSAQIWVFETQVISEAQVQYSCHCKGENATGKWWKTPSKAYVEANNALEKIGKGNPMFNRKENGALLVGVTYPAMQEVICKHFKLAEYPPRDCVLSQSPFKRMRDDTSSNEAELEKRVNLTDLLDDDFNLLDESFIDRIGDLESVHSLSPPQTLTSAMKVEVVAPPKYSVRIGGSILPLPADVDLQAGVRRVRHRSPQVLLRVFSLGPCGSHSP
ncbi:hypothetical protein BASA81_006899 [Batrachochytrium salamandrivorans]|nr:hypothetical protein BASA81_006899 [Batrachochytrium salamandrivorans]